MPFVQAVENHRQRRASSISDRMVNGWRATSCSMTRAAIRPTQDKVIQVR
jgi:hypothetical protein